MLRRMLVTETARKVGRAALDLVFPPRCGACGRHGAFVCEQCAAALSAAGPPRCRRCWRPGPDAAECLDCRLRPPAFDGLRAAFVYQGPARELVHGLKYRGLTALGEPMARLIIEHLGDELRDADLVAAVPLSGRRQRSRGYNQARVLARAIALELGLPLLSRGLARLRHTPPQARSADAETRARNVVGAFACREGTLAGARVLLVDDVTTTGATLSSCAGALKQAGAASVLALAFARED